jgi:hypothetical protein
MRVGSTKNPCNKKRRRAGIRGGARKPEHGIKTIFEMVKIDGSSVGKVLEAYVKPT